MSERRSVIHGGDRLEILPTLPEIGVLTSKK